jgi:hypothetical protein
MKEDLLHLVWKLKKLDFNNLQTTNGETIQIKKFGFHNQNSGPDFLNGEVVIGDTTWVGHIEMHINATDWTKHNHQKDKAYNNVILHVVFNDDGPISNQSGQTIPTLVLKDRISKSTIDNYETLAANKDWIPCAQSIHKTDKIKNSFFLEKVLIERLEDKCQRIIDILKHNNNDWEDTLYRLLLKYLGLKVNSSAFEQLAHVTPYNNVKKLSDKSFALEALLLGQAGLLNKKSDDYFSQLLNEYNHYKKKYDLIPMTGIEWRFSKLRPANFPTIRIAQISQLYNKTPQLFNETLHIKSVSDIYELLDVTASSYWDTHYLPEKESEKKPKKMGQMTKELIVINVIVPLMFTYGQKTDKEFYRDKALDLLQKVKAENNLIIREWKQLGMSAKSAFDSQALLQLKNEYCNNFNCLNCQMGQSILFS